MLFPNSRGIKFGPEPADFILGPKNNTHCSLFPYQSERVTSACGRCRAGGTLCIKKVKNYSQAKGLKKEKRFFLGKSPQDRTVPGLKVIHIATGPKEEQNGLKCLDLTISSAQIGHRDPINAKKNR